MQKSAFSRDAQSPQGYQSLNYSKRIQIPHAQYPVNPRHLEIEIQLLLLRIIKCFIRWLLVQFSRRTGTIDIAFAFI